MKSFKNQYSITDNFYHKPAFISINNADFLICSEILTSDIITHISEKEYFCEAENIKREFLYKVPYIISMAKDESTQAFIS